MTSGSGYATTTTTTAVETGIPTNLPKVITPPGGIPSQPINFTLVRLGFQYPLNYAFVVQHPVAVAQIFQYLPIGIANGLNISQSHAIMHTLQPYDTTKNKGWITTLAFAFIPSDMTDTLDLDRHTPASPLFSCTNPEDGCVSEPVYEMMNLLDASIPLLASTSDLNGGSSSSGGPDGSWAGGDETSNTGTDNGDAAPMGAAPSGNSAVSGKTIGLTGGIVAGAAVYGAAMFLVARRYRQRRGRHGRSNSINRSVSPGSNPASGLMGGGAAVMHGARSPFDKRGSGGRASARTQQISAPMMAENSLGWN